MPNDTLSWAKTRLAQARASLVSEGWLVVGTMGDAVVSLRHPRNGNRMTLIASVDGLFYMKNQRLVKREPSNAPAYPLT